MRRFVAGAALVALGVVQLALAGHGRADAPTKVGWWSEAQQVPAPLPTIPPPPTSPEGGITIVNAPDGPAAWGAVYYRVGDISRATLQLTSSSPITIPAGDGLLACLVQTPGWQAGGNQRWDTKPAVDPLCAPATLDASGMVATFALTGAFRDGDGAVDVAVIPTGQVPFTVNFNAPSATSLQTTPAAAPSDRREAQTPVVDAPPVVDGSLLFPDSGFTFATPPPASAGASPAQALGGYRGGAVPLIVEDHPGKERVAVVLIVVGLLLSLWRLAGTAVRAPRLLGSLGAREPVQAQAVVSGIGRFARARSDRPRRLM